MTEEYSSIMPPLSEEEYQSLKADIEQNGVLVPVEYDGNGNLLDGFHRIKACRELGIDDWPSITRLGLTETEKRTHARKINMARRHLTRKQKRKQIQAQLKDTPRWSNNRIATVLGVSPHTVISVREGMESSGELCKLQSLEGVDGIERPAEMPEEGSEPQPSIFTKSERTRTQAKKVWEAAESGDEKAQELVEQLDCEKTTITGAVKSLNKKRQEKEREQRVQNTLRQPPRGKYKTIVIDPPWPVQKIIRDVRPNQDTMDYPTMTLDEIERLPISELAFSDGCHIYLWTTHKYLPDALRLFNKWGVKYQCLMTWGKPTGMTPFSWMYDTEHVLFGRIGSLKVQEMGLRLFFQAPVTKHSEKPDIFYERVRRASPEPRLEMFARKNRAGFTAWGNELNGVQKG